MKTIRNFCLIFTALAFVFTATVAVAERGDDSDRKSKNGRIEATIDGVSVTIEFGRPNVKGRDIWGALVAYDKVWRTGADEATTISFSDDVTIDGSKLAAGTYSLFTIPGSEEWTFIFNTVAEQWGAYDHDSSKDALRVTASPKKAKKEESMNIFVDGDMVVLHWDELAVGFKVGAAG